MNYPSRPSHTIETKAGTLRIIALNGSVMQVRSLDEHENTDSGFRINNVDARMTASFERVNGTWDLRRDKNGRVEYLEMRLRRVDAFRHGKYDDSMSYKARDKAIALCLEVIAQTLAAQPNILLDAEHRFKLDQANEKQAQVIAKEAELAQLRRELEHAQAECDRAQRAAMEQRQGEPCPNCNGEDWTTGGGAECDTCDGRGTVVSIAEPVTA